MRCRYLLLVFALLGMSRLIWAPLMAQPQKAAPVWPQAPDTERLQSAFFRYEFTLNAGVDTAWLSLYADSRYHLRINGHFVAFGPARSYPAHPEFDQHDIASYLRQGPNVIAVQVLSNGTSTYQLRNNPAAFWAWGKVATQEESFDLATPGQWLCLRSQGYDAHAPKLTFAMGPMEIYDARLDPADWASPAADTRDWQAPEVLPRPWPWGDLQQRDIPLLTTRWWNPYALGGVHEIDQTEEKWSFRQPTPDSTREAYAQKVAQFGYTYVYSPRNQAVNLSLWWGYHYLNGKLIEQKSSGENQPGRQMGRATLKRGWNLLTVAQPSIWGGWDFYLGAPRSAGLELSPQRQRGDSLMLYSVADPSVAETLVAADFDPEQEAAGLAWRAHQRHALADNPARDLAWTELGPRLDFRPDQIADLTVPDESALVFDFRYKRLGRIVIEYEAAAGTVFDLGFTEDTLAGKPRVLKRHGIFLAHRHVAAGGKGRIETLRPYGLRYLLLTVKGSGGEAVQIKRVRVMEHVYPQTLLGSFACSDPAFNALWQMGWRTLQVCMEDSYTDTPFRERGLYAGDMLPQMAITLATSGDLRLVKRSLLLFQDMYVDRFQPGAPRDPDEVNLLEDYPLLTLEALVWYFDRTRDTTLVANLLPAYGRLIDQRLAARNSEGLIHNQQVFIDWIQLDKRDVHNAAYHALLARSCQQLAHLAGRLGQADRQAQYAQAEKELTEALHRTYWDPEQQAYRDGLKDGAAIDHHFPISSAWPYLFGLTTPEQEESIVPFIGQKMENIGNRTRHRETNPYGSFYLLSALYEAGEYQAAERFMRRYWMPMLLDGDDTAWENFGKEGQGTLSHAWSGHPTYFMSAKVLGVDLGWPNPIDLDTVRIAPSAASIDWARGAVPHPRGLIEVDWHIVGTQLRLSYRAPQGVTVVVEPQGRLAELELVVARKEG